MRRSSTCNLRGELVTPVARRLREMGVPFVLSTAYNHLRAENEEAFSGVANLGKPLASARCVQVLGEIASSRVRPHHPADDGHDDRKPQQARHGIEDDFHGKPAAHRQFTPHRHHDEGIGNDEGHHGKRADCLAGALFHGG